MKKTAFTLVELLVVIAVIGVLIALLLPAVQAAREAARRMQCASHLKQLGLAVHNFHDARGGLVPLCVADERPSWLTLLYPYVEQQGLYDIMCEGGTASGQGLDRKFKSDWFNSLDESTKIGFGSVPIYHCPSRRAGNNLVANPMIGSGGGFPRIGPTNDYAAVVVWMDGSHGGGGAWQYCYQQGNINISGVNWTAVSANNSFLKIASLSGNNPNHWSCSTTFASISDGTSNTLLAGEKFIRPDEVNQCSMNGATNEKDPNIQLDCSYLVAMRAVLTDGWAADVRGDAIQVARPITRDSSNPSWSENLYVRIASGPMHKPIISTTTGMMETDARGGPMGFGGCHPAGANFLIGDGSVRNMSSDIHNMALYHLARCNDGEPESFP